MMRLAAHRRSAGLAGWTVRGLPGHAGRHDGLDAQHRHLGDPTAGGTPRRVTDDPEVRLASALEPRRTAPGFVSTRDGGAQVCGGGRDGGAARKVTSLPRKRAACSGSTTGRCSSRPTCTRSARPLRAPTTTPPATASTSRRRPGRAARRGCTTTSPCAALGSLGGPPPHAPARGGPRQRGRARPHAGHDRRSPVHGRGPDDYDVAAGRPGDRVRARGRAYRGRSPRTASSTSCPSRADPRRRSAGQPGYDGAPRYSPGRDDASRSAAQMRAGYEADRWRLMVYDRATRAARNLTEPLRPPGRRPSPGRPTRARSTSPPRTTRAPDLRGRRRRRARAHRGRRRRFGDLSGGADGTHADRDRGRLTHPARDRARRARTAPAHGGHARERRRPRARSACAPARASRYTGAAGKTVQAWIVKPAGLRSRAQLPAARADPRRPAGRMERQLDATAGTPQVFAAAGYVVVHAQPARLAWAGDRSSSTTSTATGAAAPTRT